MMQPDLDCFKCGIASRVTSNIAVRLTATTLSQASGGIASTGNETPDWLVEGGLRRPAGKIFVRYDSYGMNGDISPGVVFVFGVGVNL